MTTLHAFGCSYTWGASLKDTIHSNAQHSQYAWPTLLADKLQIPYYNLGKPGSSRNRVFYYLLAQLELIKPGDIVCIQWPYHERQMQILPNNKILDLYPGVPPRLPKPQLLNFKKSLQGRISQIYYKHFWTKENSMWQSTITVAAAIGLLERKGVRQYHQFTEQREQLKNPVLDWVKVPNCVSRLGDVVWHYPKAHDKLHPGPEAHSALADLWYNRIKLDDLQGSKQDL